MIILILVLIVSKLEGFSGILRIVMGSNVLVSNLFLVSSGVIFI